VREHLEWGQQKRFLTFVICPKHTNSQTAWNLLSVMIFPECTKMIWPKWKISSTFLKCPKLPGSIQSPKNLPKHFEFQDFPDCTNFCATVKCFLNFIIFPGSLKNSKRPSLLDLFKYLDLLSSQFLSRNEMFFNLYSLGSIKILKLSKNSSILEKNSEEFSRTAKNFGQYEKFLSLPKLPKLIV